MLPSGGGAMSNKKMFTRITEWAARVSGEPASTLLAVLVVVVWACTGPLFGYSDTWQLVINTLTTLVTFLMVFLIQSSQNRGSEAVQIKLDEIIRALKQADNAVLGLEQLDEAELDLIRAKYDKLAQIARSARPHRAGQRK
jgi:low affinity Fe/Cu permease